MAAGRCNVVTLHKCVGTVCVYGHLRRAEGHVDLTLQLSSPPCPVFPSRHINTPSLPPALACDEESSSSPTPHTSQSNNPFALSPNRFCPSLRFRPPSPLPLFLHPQRLIDSAASFSRSLPLSPPLSHKHACVHVDSGPLKNATCDAEDRTRTRTHFAFQHSFCPLLHPSLRSLKPPAPPSPPNPSLLVLLSGIVLRYVYRID